MIDSCNGGASALRHSEKQKINSSTNLTGRALTGASKAGAMIFCSAFSPLNLPSHERIVPGQLFVTLSRTFKQQTLGLLAARGDGLRFLQQRLLHLGHRYAPPAIIFRSQCAEIERTWPQEKGYWTDFFGLYQCCLLEIRVECAFSLILLLRPRIVFPGFLRRTAAATKGA